MEAVMKHRTARNLVHRLSTATTADSRSSALAEARLLSKHDPDIRTHLADSGIVPILTFLLLQQPQPDDRDDTEADLFIQENALATLLNLSISSPESLMSAPALLPSLSLALRRGCGSHHVLAQHAAATLYSLLSVDAYRPIIGSRRTQIISPLISLIRQNKQMEAGIKHRTALNLVHRLSTATTADSLSSALAETRLLSKHDPDIRTHLADSGIVPILTFLLLQQPQPDDRDDTEADLFIQENALATLLNLSISSPESLMSAPSLLPSLSLALRRGCGAHHVLAQHAAATLYSLLSVDAYRPIIGSRRTQIISPLISLIRVHDSPARTIKDALKALFGVALYPLNRPSLVELGIVPALFSLVVGDGRTGIVEDASAVIAQVAGCHESVEAFRMVGGVRILVGLAAADDEGKIGGRGRENAASGLLNLAMSGGEMAVRDIMEVETVEEAMRELASRGSARARAKAEVLLRELERMRASRCKYRHHYVHVDRSQFQSLPRSSSSSIDTGSF